MVKNLGDKYKSKKGVIVAPIAEYHYLIADSYDDYIKITSINIKGKILDQFNNRIGVKPYKIILSDFVGFNTILSISI